MCFCLFSCLGYLLSARHVSKPWIYLWNREVTNVLKMDIEDNVETWKNCNPLTLAIVLKLREFALPTIHALLNKLPFVEWSSFFLVSTFWNSLKDILNLHTVYLYAPRCFLKLKGYLKMTILNRYEISINLTRYYMLLWILSVLLVKTIL